MAKIINAVGINGKGVAVAIDRDLTVEEQLCKYAVINGTKVAIIPAFETKRGFNIEMDEYIKIHGDINKAECVFVVER